MAQKLNITMLRNDLSDVGYKASCEFRKNLKSLDYEATVGKMLKKWGYSYTLNPETGDFTITVAPGCYVRAEMGEELYGISVEMNYNGLSASSTYDRSPIQITPYSIRDCKSVFDKLVTGLQAEYAKCEAINKGDKGAKLITSMVRPVLRKLKLSGVKIERCDDSPGYFWLVRQLFGNVWLRVKVSFNDYEEGCSRLAAAIKNQPDCALDNPGVYYTHDCHYYTPASLTNHGRGRGLVKTMDDGRMVYDPSVKGSEHDNNHTDSELSKILSDMGRLSCIMLILGTCPSSL